MSWYPLMCKQWRKPYPRGPAGYHATPNRNGRTAPDSFRPCWQAVTASLGRAVQRNEGSLFDNLIGDGRQWQRHCEAERLGRLQIDHKLEFGWEQHGQIKDIDTPA